jgi:hypothetical protein
MKDESTPMTASKTPVTRRWAKFFSALYAALRGFGMLSYLPGVGRD